MEALNFGAFGRSFAGTVGPFGGLKFGAVDTPAPPKPSGWVVGVDPGALFVPSTALSAVPNHLGWVRQIGAIKAEGKYAAVQTEAGDWLFPWALAYATTDGTRINWYFKYAASQPGFPAVPAPANGDAGGGAAAPATPVAKLQKALNMADALGKDGRPLVVDGIIGTNTCWACYQFQKEIASLKQQPTLSKEFFLYLGLPGDYANTLGNACTAYYTGPMPELPEEPPYVPPTPKPPVSDDTEDIVPPPEITEITKAGFPWWMGVLLAGTLVGTAVLAKRKKKGRKRSTMMGRRRRRR
jgi:hypothetical protein